MFTVPFTFFSQGSDISFDAFIGGDFTLVNFSGSYNNSGYFAKTNQDGADLISPDPGFNGIVKAIKYTSAGGAVIGGSFTEYNGTSVGNIIKITSSGNIDTSFNSGTGFDGDVETIWLNDDGTMVVGGAFTTYNGSSSPGLIKLNADGSIDTNFNVGTGASGTVYSVKKNADGYYVFCGLFGDYNNTQFRSTNNFCHVDDTGQIPAFSGYYTGLNTNGAIRDIALLSVSGAFIVGDFTLYGGISTKGVGKLESSYYPSISNYNTNAAFTSFNSVTKVEEIADGDVVMVGDFTSTSGITGIYYVQNGSTSYLQNLYNSSSLFINGVIRDVAVNYEKNVIAFGGDFYSSGQSFGSEYNDRIAFFDLQGNGYGDPKIGVQGNGVYTIELK